MDRDDFERARRKYLATHWGRSGPAQLRRLRVADPFDDPPVELGELVAVLYRTRKGTDSELVDYDHGFKRTRPRLCFNDGGLIIAGGSYRVTWRGIVG